jgi:hypothetical protein
MMKIEKVLNRNSNPQNELAVRIEGLTGARWIFQERLSEQILSAHPNPQNGCEKNIEYYHIGLSPSSMHPYPEHKKLGLPVIGKPSFC